MGRRGAACGLGWVVRLGGAPAGDGGGWGGIVCLSHLTHRRGGVGRKLSMLCLRTHFSVT